MKQLGALLLTLLLAFNASAADEEYSPATIVDVTIQQQVSSGNPLINNGGISSSNLRLFTIDLDGKRYTATQYSMGGGAIYISNNPAMFTVGSTFSAPAQRCQRPAGFGRGFTG